MAENNNNVPNQDLSADLVDFEDNENRQATRRQYRNVINDLQEHKEDLITPGTDHLDVRLKQVEDLLNAGQVDKAVRPREVALDSQAMNLIANMGRMRAQALATEFVRFQPTAFALKVKSMVDGPVCGEDTSLSSVGWSQLGALAQPHFKKTPPFQYMFGAFDRGPRPVKERQQRQPRDKDNIVAKETVPQQLKQFTGDNQSEATSEEVERVLGILQQNYKRSEGCPLDYFEFVLNPDSFGHTVENIFHVSFLVRDGLASIYLDDDDLPVIKPIEPGKKGKEKEALRSQTIISLSPPEWREFVDAFGVQEAQIPPRSSLQNGKT